MQSKVKLNSIFLNINLESNNNPLFLFDWNRGLLLVILFCFNFLFFAAILLFFTLTCSVTFYLSTSISVKSRTFWTNAPYEKADLSLFSKSQ